MQFTDSRVGGNYDGAFKRNTGPSWTPGYSSDSTTRGRYSTACRSQQSILHGKVCGVPLTFTWRCCGYNSGSVSLFPTQKSRSGDRRSPPMRSRMTTDAVDEPRCQDASPWGGLCQTRSCNCFLQQQRARWGYILILFFSFCQNWISLSDAFIFIFILFIILLSILLFFLNAGLFLKLFPEVTGY